MAMLVELEKEQLCEGLTRSYTHDRQILILTFSDIHQHTADVWADAVREAFATWPADRPFLGIYDYSGVENMSFTPYLRKKSSEITPLSPEKPGRSAIVLPRTFVAQIISYYLRTQRNRLRPRRIFFSLEEAAQWCEEMLIPEKRI